jgi:hypothetical protein
MISPMVHRTTTRLGFRLQGEEVVEFAVELSLTTPASTFYQCRASVEDTFFNSNEYDFLVAPCSQSRSEALAIAATSITLSRAPSSSAMVDARYMSPHHLDLDAEVQNALNC